MVSYLPLNGLLEVVNFDLVRDVIHQLLLWLRDEGEREREECRERNLEEEKRVGIERGER